MIKWSRRGISWCKRQISRCQRRKEAGIVIDAVFPTGSDGTRSRMTTRKVNLILSENLECVYFYQP